MIKQIHVTQLRAGMHLHKLDGAWTEHPFWRRSFVLTGPDLIKLVRTGIEFAWIDTDQGLDVDETPHEVMEEPEVSYVEMPTLPAATEPMPLATGETVELDLHRANELCVNAAEVLRQVMHDVRMGRALNNDACRAVIEEIVDHVADNANALILAVRMRNHDENSYMHGVSVCALMVALARQLGFNRRQMCQAGLSGLLHDIGKTLIPAELLNKPGKLTADEYRLVKTHAQRGHALLSQSVNPCPMSLEVCLHHHERMDGSGYPQGLMGNDISLFAKMAAICDTYDSITSEKPHKGRLDPSTALRVMASRDGQFDPLVFQVFVKTVGIYPVGTVVKLQSQRLAVVIGHDADNLLRPHVKVFYSLASQEALPPQDIRLAKPECDDRIVAIEPSNEMHLLAMEML
jgi:HD-GYP domain-containing protein (c-di-GMP phosphodiesterase class II)